jgi:hypothetical protein
MDPARVLEAEVLPPTPARARLLFTAALYQT